jgi:hypothetical protein
LPSFEEIAVFVRAGAKRGDLVITMGAGDIYKVGEMILDMDHAPGGEVTRGAPIDGDEFSEELSGEKKWMIR